VSYRLQVSFVVHLGGGNGIENCLSIVNCLSLNPDGSHGCGLHHSTDISDGHGHEVSHSLGSCRHESHLVGHSRSLGLFNSLGVVNDFGADPDTGVCSRLNDSAEFCHCHKVRLSLMDGLCCGVGHGIRLGVHLSLCLRRSCCEGVLNSLGPILNFCRCPDACGWHDFD
jgi:hypothetical protein